MFRVPLFILFVLNFAVFAQTGAETEKISKATKFNEFGASSHSILRGTLDSFLVKLRDNPELRGYILNYGTDEMVAGREKSINFHLSIRRFPVSRIEMLKAGFRNELNTELWIAPEGSLPEPLLTSRKIGELNVTGQNASMRARLKIIGKTLKGNLRSHDAVRVVFRAGNASELKRIETFVRKTLFENCRDCFGYSRGIAFVNRGKAKTSKVEFWIVPAGAEMPEFD